MANMLLLLSKMVKTIEKNNQIDCQHQMTQVRSYRLLAFECNYILYVLKCLAACRGVHLKDLILLHTALPDWVEDVYVNFRKMVQLSMIFTELMQVQNATLPIEPNMDLVNTVRVRFALSVFHLFRFY